MLSSIEFEKGSGGTSRTSDSPDGISGLLFYGTVPSGFASDAVQQVFSTSEAELLGLTQEAEPLIHYHVSQFFEKNPAGNLYIGTYALPAGAHDFAEVVTMQVATGGAIRFLGVYTTKVYDTTLLTALQAKCAQLETEHMPLNAVLTADISGATLSALAEIVSLQSEAVSADIGQDGNNIGAALFADLDVTVGALGALVGTVSKAAVHESIAWVGKYPLTGAEFDVPAFGNGVLVKNVTTTQLNDLDSKGYIFIQKHLGIGGSYFNASYTASNDDYLTIERGRTIDKAIRNIRSAVLPLLNGPVYLKSGKLSMDTIQTYQAAAQRPIDQMLNARELSEGKAFVNPDQNILSDDTLRITVELVPVGVARKIKFTIGYKVKLTA